MSGDLAAFLAARLDEDEAAANAGARRVGMPWHAEPQPGCPGGLVIDELGLVGSTGGRYAADHIARHDPARVLREVKAGRRILARHSPAEGISGTCCTWCSDDTDTASLNMPWPCPDVRDLLSRWSDRADYDSSWALEKGD